MVVYSVGPQPIRLVIAIGNSLPCRSSSNETLFEGSIESGQAVLTETRQVPICVEHTYGSFPDTDWSQGVWLPPGCGSKSGCRLPPVIRAVVSSNPG